MNTTPTSNIKVHTSCDTLPIFSFYKIIHEGDFRYLIKDYFGEKNIELPTSINFEEIFESILNEYNAVCANKAEITKLKKEIYIAELEFKYFATIDILKLYTEYPEIEVFWLLSEVGWDVNIDKPMAPQVEKITKDVVGLKMQIKIKKANFVEANKQKALQVNDFDIETECLYLEQNLELGYHLDPKHVTCTRYAKMKKMQKEKHDYYEKQKQELENGN